MSSVPAPPLGLHATARTPVAGLAMAERRVKHPLATVIAVHGGLDRGGSFARLARRLEQFDLVTYDRRGYQGSRNLAPLNLRSHVEDLLAIARSEASRGPVILFGHSFGGVVTLAAAATEPNLVDLVIVYEAPLPWVLRRESTRAPLGADAGLEAERFFRRIVSNSAWERLSESERTSRRADGPALVDDLTGLHSGTVPFDVSQLKVPTLYAHGDGHLRDYYRDLCLELVRLNPAIGVRELSNAGHGAHLSTPDQLAELLAEEWGQICESA